MSSANMLRSLANDLESLRLQATSLVATTTSSDNRALAIAAEADALAIMTALSSASTNDEEPTLVRVTQIRDGGTSVEWCAETELTLDTTHIFHRMHLVTTTPSLPSLHVSCDDIIVNTDILRLLSMYSMWHKRDLKAIASVHDIRVLSRDTAATLLDRLYDHHCTFTCRHALAIFTTLRVPRPPCTSSRPRPLPRAAVSMSPTAFMSVADDSVKRLIIADWQNTVTTENMRLEPCAVCAQSLPSRTIASVEPSAFDLSLVRNDALPPRVLPTTYAFELYDRALLYPPGMSSRWNKGPLRLCKVCRTDLIDNHVMPKLSLANWLYYGIDELPSNVSTALTNSTHVDRLLISRARTSRISFRFKQVFRPEHGPSSQSSSSHPTYPVSQKYLRGNVLVMPQNSTHLNRVLPPPPSVVRDTVCAVFVGRSKPTTETIKKMRPLLARKSTVHTLITFLVEHNPYYAADHVHFDGLNQSNLDALFSAEDASDDPAVPCCLQIGFLQDNDALRSSTSDYTHRNDDDDELHQPPDSDSLLMENVGYTCGDESPVAYRDMKMRALSHCLDSGPFLCSRAGDTFVPDFKNPSLLTWLFPHLDPWGIGGFHHPNRIRPISMEDQLKYLLELDDQRFQNDPDFAFVYYNILQKKLICDSVRFRVKETQQRRIVSSLLAVDKEVLRHLISRFENDATYTPQTSQEHDILSLIDSVSTVLPNVPGTTGYKLSLRNEIRSLVTFIGTPAFFITLNPSDIHHPLVRLFAGQHINLEDAAVGEEYTSWQRKLLAASHPSACAKFFHTIISNFVSIVLRYGKPSRGLFGECTAYYGTVEAQARGTLHCHMLVWIKNHPSPQKMRDHMRDSQGYTDQLISWLESLIKSELLGTTEPVIEQPGKPLPRPPFTETFTNIHPGVKTQPRILDIPPHQFQDQYTVFVNELVQQYNWHEHTDTCWKYLRRSQPRTDENCRMRIDGSTRHTTEIDSDTQSIQLRRLHPRIANYNDLVIFLVQANMDIKHIGSGEAAKALIYYITDYITKSSIPAHLGLAALMYAINSSDAKYRTLPANTEDPSFHRSALTTVVNSLLSRMEISHPQVMSYLVGGGDHYTSHRYRLLHYTVFDHLVRQHYHDPRLYAAPIDDLSASNTSQSESASLENTSNLPDLTPQHNTAAYEPQPQSEQHLPQPHQFSEPTITLSLTSGSISAVNQKQDYLLRPSIEPFDSMSLYQYVGLTEKITSTHDTQRLQRSSDTQRLASSPGRPREQRGNFLSDHPDHTTHVVHKRVVWVVPVLLGPRIPRNDKSDDEREDWARIILLLFMPWRSPADLKTHDETWYAAYERQQHTIPHQHHTIISNMNILNECRDARDKCRTRLRGNQSCLVSTLPPTLPSQQTPNNSGSISDDDDSSANDLGFDDLPQPNTNYTDHATSNLNRSLLDLVDDLISIPARLGVNKCFDRPSSQLPCNSIGSVTECTPPEAINLERQHAQMRTLKRKRRPEPTQVLVSPFYLPTTSTNTTPPTLTRTSLTEHNTSSSEPVNAIVGANPTYDELQNVIDAVILHFRLRDNAEQLRAFEIIARHVCFGGEQLLMYIGGVGGTGKSYLVQAIIHLFCLLARRHQILLSAPTGAAAVLISGYTIHSLLLLPNRSQNPNLQSLALIWENVLYLIIDEVSMISATLLSQISSRLQHAKGNIALAEDLPFGGINVIFLGDFGQLKPVNGAALYANKFIRNPTIHDAHSHSALAAVKGIYLWRNLVSTVVILKTNQRQRGDIEYSTLLDRIRRGKSGDARHSKQAYDFNTLQQRLLQNFQPETYLQFAEAPLIVGRKHIRDALNNHLLHLHANRIGAEVHVYYAVDKSDHSPLQGADSELVLDLPSSTTHDSLGRLPLFPGMNVMIQENIAFVHNVVNGAIGTIRDIKYNVYNGRRSVAVVYVHIPGAGRLLGQADNDLIPVFPTPHYFSWIKRPAAGNNAEISFNITRLQPPILPAYAYTDYKSQGRSLDTAIVDLESSLSMQGAYVMLSRVRTLNGLAVLRPFRPSKIEKKHI